MRSYPHMPAAAARKRSTTTRRSPRAARVPGTADRMAWYRLSAPQREARARALGMTADQYRLVLFR
jgi:ribosomal protein L15E